MKEGQTNFEMRIIDNIRKMMMEKKFTQATFAEYMGTSEGQFSKILSGKHHLSFHHLEKLASSLSLSEMDIITYSNHFMESVPSETEPVEAILQIKLKKDKKDQVLKLIFGDNNIEILNK